MRLGNHELENLTAAIRALKLSAALPALERVFREFAARPIEPPEGVSGDCRALLLLAETILALDPDSMLAAEYLVGALRRAEGEGRWNVLWAIAVGYRSDLSRPALHLLRDTIRAELKGEER